MAFLRLALKTLRLSLMRVGAGWMFALLTFNFNRVTISDLGAIAVVVTTLIGLHHFIAFFQVYWGRIADRYPIFGLRRTPYIVLSSFAASLVFLAIPSVAVGLGSRDPLATAAAFGLILIFGICMAANGSASNSLVAEVTTPKERGGVIAFVWATVIISGIGSAIVAQVIMPVYTPEAMQQLYNLTPFVVLISVLLGVVGMERPISREAHQALLAKQPAVGASPIDTFRVARDLMKRNPQVRGFFMFVLLAIMGIFLQDAILEPFGADVFGMTQAETAGFQQVWGGGALLGMLGIGILSTLLPLQKKSIATIGGMGVAGGLGLIALSAAMLNPSFIQPGLFLLGLGIGLFNVGALSMMMEMTIEGQTGLYMGLWGMAQGLGNGFANIFSGGLITALIETNFLSDQIGFTLIFGFEALVMIAAIGVLRGISIQEFKGLSNDEIGRALAMDVAGD